MYFKQIDEVFLDQLEKENERDDDYFAEPDIDEPALEHLNEYFQNFDPQNPNLSSQMLNHALNKLRNKPETISKFVGPENIPQIVNLAENKGSRKNVFRFLTNIIQHNPQMIDSIAESDIFKYLYHTLRFNSQKEPIFYAFELTLILSQFIDRTFEKLYNEKVLLSLVPNIKEENIYTDVSLQVFIYSTNIDTIPENLSEYLIDPLINLVLFSENTSFVTKSLRILSNIASCPIDFSTQIIDSCLIDTLSSYITSDDHFLQIAVFQFLGTLCPFGDRIYKEFVSYSVFPQTKKVLLDTQQKEETYDYSVIMLSAVSFLRCWSDNNSNLYLNSLFSFVSQLPLHSLFEETAFDVKVEILKLLLILTSIASPEVIINIIDSDILDLALTSIEATNFEFCYNTIKIIDIISQRLSTFNMDYHQEVCDLFATYFDCPIEYFRTIDDESLVEEIDAHYIG